MQSNFSRITVSLAALGAAGMLACSSAGGGSGYGGIAAASSGGSAGSGQGGNGGLVGGTGGSGGLVGGSGGSGGALPTDCGELTTYIYVLDMFGMLRRFDPAALAFEDIGPLACPGASGLAFSMAVQRNGTAWVLYNDGRLFNASIVDASCTATAFAPNQQGFALFGMAFVSDAPGSASEGLYVAQADATATMGNTLGRIDVNSLQLQVVGPYSAISKPAELTGTGDANLFGYFRTEPNITVAHIDKGNAAILTQGQPSVAAGMAWAFAFWGGEFWMFSASGFNSKLDRYNLATGQTTNVFPDIGFTAVGAGVSTCAPLQMPR